MIRIELNINDLDYKNINGVTIINLGKYKIDAINIVILYNMFAEYSVDYRFSEGILRILSCDFISLGTIKLEFESKYQRRLLNLKNLIYNT